MAGGPWLPTAVVVRRPIYMHACIQIKLLFILVVTCEQLTDIYNVHAALGCFWVQRLPLCHLMAKTFSYSCYAPRLWPW